MFFQIPIAQTFNSPLGQTKNISDLVSFFLNASFVISGLAIFFFVLVAGYNMIAGAGSGDANAAKKGKEAAGAALIGFIIVFVAYWIVRAIEVIIGVDFITVLNF